MARLLDFECYPNQQNDNQYFSTSLVFYVYFNPSIIPPLINAHLSTLTPCTSPPAAAPKPLTNSSATLTPLTTAFPSSVFSNSSAIQASSSLSSPDPMMDLFIEEANTMRDFNATAACRAKFLYRRLWVQKEIEEEGGKMSEYSMKSSVHLRNSCMLRMPLLTCLNLNLPSFPHRLVRSHASALDKQLTPSSRGERRS